MSRRFRKVFDDTVAKLAAKPRSALQTFHAESRQVRGFMSQVAVRTHRFQVDEPKGIGGSDVAASPVEYVLGALAACQEVTYRLYADALDIPLAGVSVRVEGVSDRRGFFGVDDTVRPGFQEIQAVVHLDSTAPPEDLARLKDMVDAHCPVLDALARPTPVTTTLAGSEEAVRET